MRDKIIVLGDVIRITETHYITSFNGGISSWSKKYYKLPHITKIQSQ